MIDWPSTEALEGVVKPGEKFVAAVFRRPDVSAYGYLLFESFNDRRQPIPVPRGGREVVQKLRDRLSAFVDRVRTLGASGSGLNDQTQSFQLQVFMQGFAQSTPGDRAEAALIFAEFRGLLARGLPTEDQAGASDAAESPDKRCI